jgi:hypothetical protein
VSSFLQNTLSNYFEAESPNDQVYSKQIRSIKQKKKKRKTKIRIPGIKRFTSAMVPKNVATLYTPWVTWKKYSIHWVCPWGQVSSQDDVP